MLSLAQLTLTLRLCLYVNVAAKGAVVGKLHFLLAAAKVEMNENTLECQFRDFSRCEINELLFIHNVTDLNKK